MTELIKAMQKALNAGGFKGANGASLTEDGILGANTQFALNAQAVAANSQGTVDATARAEATKANTRLNKLHAV